MYRKQLIKILEDRPMTLRDLAKRTRAPVVDLDDDLKHLIQSLKHTDYRLEAIPARCKKCGFEFSDDHFKKPSKCPECRGTWTTEPLVSIVKAMPQTGQK